MVSTGISGAWPTYLFESEAPAPCIEATAGMSTSDVRQKTQAIPPVGYGGWPHVPLVFLSAAGGIDRASCKTNPPSVPPSAQHNTAARKGGRWMAILRGISCAFVPAHTVPYTVARMPPEAISEAPGARLLHLPYPEH